MKPLYILALSLLLNACTTIENSLFEMGLSVERSLSNFEKKQIQLSDHNWVYLEANADQGLPTVVLLHGFAAEKDNWTRMVRHLENYHVIAPDLPGHGESSFDDNAFYGFDKQSQRVAEFINALGLTQFHIAGNSMGGAIAALYAYRHPKSVLSLSLIDAVGFYGDTPSELQLLLENKQKNPLIVRSREDMDILMGFAMHQIPFIPWPGEKVLARRAIKRQNANDQIFKHIYQESEAARYTDAFTNIFSKLNIPAYVVWGEKDRVLHVSSVDKFFQYLPDVQVDVLPEVGHAPMLEVPEKTAQLLADFWIYSVQPSSKLAAQ